jgi:isoleucyl-tRNA synthetase
VFESFQKNKIQLQNASTGRLSDEVILFRLSQASTKIHNLYSAYEFSRGATLLNNFIFHDLSAFYFETLKDSIYTGFKKDCLAAQQALGVIFYELLQMLAPLCPLLVEEVWDHLPKGLQDKSIHPAQSIWTPFTVPYDMERVERQSYLITEVSTVIKAAQERLRQNKIIGSGLETDVVIGVHENIHPLTAQCFHGPSGKYNKEHNTIIKHQLEAAFVVSDVEVVPMAQLLEKWDALKKQGVTDVEKEDCLVAPEKWMDKGTWDANTVTVLVRKAEMHKCPRCWRHVAEEEDALCNRCHDVIREQKESVVHG